MHRLDPERLTAVIHGHVDVLDVVVGEPGAERLDDAREENLSVHHEEEGLGRARLEQAEVGLFLFGEHLEHGHHVGVDGFHSFAVGKEAGDEVVDLR